MTRIVLFAALIVVVSILVPPTKPVSIFCLGFCIGCLGIGIWHYNKKKQ